MKTDNIMMRRVAQNIFLVAILLCLQHPVRIDAKVKSFREVQIGNSGDTEGILLGVKLRPKVLALLKEIEKLYGKPVEAEFANISVTPEGDDRAGRAIITDEGVPTIKVDKHIDPKDAQRVERILAHELLHLRLRAKGYPVLHFHGETGLMTEIGPYLLETGNSLRNGIEHWLFAPDLRAMGFDPGDEIKRGMEKFSQAAKAGKGDDVLLALYYYRAILEYDDPALLAKLKQGYIEGNRLGVIKTGERLAQVVLNDKPKTPDAVGKTLLSCLDTLFQKQIVFTVLQSSEKVSGAVKLPRINLRVTTNITR